MIINKLKKLTAITAMAAFALTAAAVPVTQADAAGTDTAEFYVSYNGANYMTVPFGMGTGNIANVDIDEDAGEATIQFQEATYNVPGGAQTGYLSDVSGDAVIRTEWDYSKNIPMVTEAVVDLSEAAEIGGIENAVHVSISVVSEGEHFATLPGTIHTSDMDVDISDVILAFEY